MPNKNYIKGVRKERSLVNSYRELGDIAFRSAGSHSPIDVCAIVIKDKKIYFYQCKPDNFSEKKRLEILQALKELNGTYEVLFTVI